MYCMLDYTSVKVAYLNMSHLVDQGPDVMEQN